MRYIPLKDHQPDQAWIDKANHLIDALRVAPDSEARKKIIDADANKRVWGELKGWLLSLSHHKCWFSEAKDCFSHWDVEHYRPKKSAKDRDGTEYDCYWWLAFDWTNFRICGNVGNRKKGTFFPLRDGCPRIAPFGDVRLEEPLLLDPADPDDPSLISFDVEGNAIFSPAFTDPWEKERVEYSIERYNLNDYQPLVDKRKIVWNDCWMRIQEYLRELNAYHQSRSMIAHQLSKEKAQQIRKMLHEDQEFSAVARACLLNTGDPRVAGFLRST
ncbi:MAG: hypothetical protein HZB51_01870 [Chloroflexi bacterium]|nr:hypothetical protein [Chloroflexota bacterium]